MLMNNQLQKQSQNLSEQRKTRYDLVPSYGLEEVNKVLTQKLEKFDRNEWKYGLNWSDVLSSLKKHLNEFETGRDFTSEGLLNIAEVAANAMIIAEYYKTYPQGDDRMFCPVNKPVIGCDIDNVLLDFNGGYLEKFGKVLNPYWNGDYKMDENLKSLESDKDFWLNLKPLHKPSFEIDYYITSRNVPVEWTMESLEKNGFPCAPVYTIGWDCSKIETLKKLGVTLMIDDRWLNYKECHENGIFCYLMDAPHNQHYKNLGHRRIFDLSNPLK